MKNSLQKNFIFLILISFLSSCSTIHQANCPSFKTKTNKAAIAQAKLKQKERKQMFKVKADLAEKYAQNTKKNKSDKRTALNRNDNGVFDKLDVITETQIASTDFEPTIRFDHRRFPNPYLMAKEIATNTDNNRIKKRFNKVERKIEKIKQRVKKIKAKKSPQDYISADDDPRKGLLGGIFGIVSYLSIGIFGIGIGFAIAAIILGKKGRYSTNRPWAIAGIVLGSIMIIGLILLVLLLVLVFAALSTA